MCVILGDVDLLSNALYNAIPTALGPVILMHGAVG